jgi:hypothetical protein
MPAIKVQTATVNHHARYSSLPFLHHGKYLPNGDNFVCADCGHEWPAVRPASADEPYRRLSEPLARRREIDQF